MIPASPRRPFVSLFLLALLLRPAAGAPARAAEPAAPGTPRILFSETIHDFGNVPPNQAARHEFIVTNAGTATLLVTDVRPGCGCMTAGAWDREVAPGKTGRIPIKFSSGVFRGPISKGILVVCNDPAQTNAMLQIKARIWTPLDVETPYAYFLPVEDELTNQTKVIRIGSNAEQLVTLQAPRSSHPSFLAELRTNQAGKEFALHVTYLPGANPTNAQGRISVETSVEEMPMLHFTAFARPQAAVAAQPESLALPGGATIPAGRLTTTIRNNSRRAVQVSEPVTTLEGVTVGLNELRPGAEYRLNVDYPMGFKLPASGPAEVTVKTTHPRYPLFRVPLRTLASGAPGGALRVVDQPKGNR